MKKLVHFIVVQGTNTYWFLRKSKTHSAKALIMCNGELLLVRNKQGSGKWNLPGGRIEKGESLAFAIRREVKEELGIIISEVLYLGSMIGLPEYKKDTVHCFMSIISDKKCTIQPEEIHEARWFPVGAIPNNRSVIVHKTLSLYESAFV